MGLNITFLIPVVMPFVFQFLTKMICLVAGVTLSPINLAIAGFVGAFFGIIVWLGMLIFEVEFTISDLRDIIRDIEKEI